MRLYSTYGLRGDGANQLMLTSPYVFPDLNVKRGKIKIPEYLQEATKKYAAVTKQLNFPDKVIIMK